MASRFIYYYFMLFIGTLFLHLLAYNILELIMSLSASSHPLEGCPKDGVVFYCFRMLMISQGYAMALREGQSVKPRRTATI